jgi:UDP-2,3-diacylglucosamine pyrophosphatase LpxH
MARKQTTILVIPDLHSPCHHPDALRFLKEVAAEHRPDAVVLLGDLSDSHSLSRYDADPDLPSPGEELRRAAKALKPFFRFVDRLVPTEETYVCYSNHDDRLQKRAAKAGLPSGTVRRIGDILGAPAGWSWADSHELDGVRFIHGDGFSGDGCALKAARQFRQPVVMGHVHTQAGVQYDATANSTVWGLSAGCLIAEAAPVFGYKKHSPKKAVLGCGVVRDGVPVFIPLK